MEESNSREARKDGAQEAVTTGSGRSGEPTCKRRRRYDDDADLNNGGGDSIDCSGKYCGSCAAGLIADCVALCCCPCAVVNLLTLAFVKVPWKVGRRCLGLGKKKRKKLESRRKSRKSAEDYGMGVGMERNGGMVEILSGFEGGEEMYEAEKVWFELYEIGQLGFGRVSSFE